MRWIYEVPELGDERIIRRFLYFPMYITPEIRWLETVYIRQVYVYEYDGLHAYSHWKNVMWSSESQYLEGKQQ